MSLVGFRRAFAEAVDVLVLAVIPACFVEDAAEEEKTRSHGLAVGLPLSQVDEVIQAMNPKTGGLPRPYPWEDVRAALTARALGKEWRPAP